MLTLDINYRQDSCIQERAADGGRDNEHIKNTGDCSNAHKASTGGNSPCRYTHSTPRGGELRPTTATAKTQSHWSQPPRHYTHIRLFTPHSWLRRSSAITDQCQERNIREPPGIRLCRHPGRQRRDQALRLSVTDRGCWISRLWRGCR